MPRQHYHIQKLILQYVDIAMYRATYRYEKAVVSKHVNERLPNWDWKLACFTKNRRNMIVKF